jgi:glycosyltransferase involved in cell wall biosynthesis
MSALPLVSVIMPNYNYLFYLEQSVQSVLQQTFSNFELIIVDDASADGSVELLKDLQQKDARIKVLYNQENRGVVFCRNTAIEISEGQYLSFIDPDDIWNLNKLEVQLNALQNNQGNLCFSDIQIIDANGNKLKKRKHSFNEYSYKSLLKRNFVPHSSLLLQRDILGNIRYPEILPKHASEKWLMSKLGIKKIIHEDYALLLHIFKNKAVHAIHINEVLVLYRVHNNNYSGNHFKKLLSLYCIYKNTQGFGVIKSMYFTVRLAFFASVKNIS